jgi:cell division septum initiation protein DivIVA
MCVNNVEPSPVMTSDGIPELIRINPKLTLMLLLAQLQRRSKEEEAFGLETDLKDIEVLNGHKQNLEQQLSTALSTLETQLKGNDDEKTKAQKTVQECAKLMQDIQIDLQSINNVNQMSIQTKLSNNQAAMNLLSSLLGMFSQYMTRG